MLCAISMRVLGQKWLERRMDIARMLFVLHALFTPFALSLSKRI
jgi:hypothetical protein